MKLYLVSVMYFFNKDNYEAFFKWYYEFKIDPYFDYYIGFEIDDLLNDLEVIYNLTKEFLNFLSHLKRSIFDDLNINNTFEGASFNIIFNVILDSDSWIELCNRLGVLEVANNRYPFYQSDYL